MKHLREDFKIKHSLNIHTLRPQNNKSKLRLKNTQKEGTTQKQQNKEHKTKGKQDTYETR